MSTDPRAKAALDAEWEKLRFLKRPHPCKGHGAWDEGNVREASAVRKGRRIKAIQFTLGGLLNFAMRKGVS